MKSMGVTKGVKKSGTSNVGDNNNLFSSQAHIQKSSVEGLGYPVMRTPRTENRRPAFV
jgi:hypothetical protein